MNGVVETFLKSDSDKEIRNFMVAANSLAKILQLEGKKTRGFLGKSLPYFSTLSKAEQKRATQDVLDYLRICKAEMAEHGTLTKSSSFIWKGLKDLGFTFPSDLFSVLRDNQVIEIYSLGHKQVFRNLNFFDYVSYTVEDLYCRPWPKLFYRADEKIGEKMIDVIGQVVSTKQPYFNKDQYIPDHLVEERGSEREIKVLYKLKSFHPVFRDHAISGYLVIEEAEILSQRYPMDVC